VNEWFKLVITRNFGAFEQGYKAKDRFLRMLSGQSTKPTWHELLKTMSGASIQWLDWEQI